MGIWRIFLYCAAEMGHEDMVVAEGHTALSLAEMRENKNIIQLLLN